MTAPVIITAIDTSHIMTPTPDSGINSLMMSIITSINSPITSSSQKNDKSKKHDVETGRD